MKYIYDHDLHIHSQISVCSSHPGQTAECILNYALENGLKKICVTDHFWDDAIPCGSEWYHKQNYAWIERILPLPKADGVKFLFGAETEMDKHLTIGMGKEYYDKFDFIIVPTTHLNNVGFGLTVEEGESVEGRVQAWLRKVDGLLSADLPFHKVGAAHLACGLIAPKHEDVLAVLESLPEAELRRLFKRAEEVGIGIELNSYDMDFAENEASTFLRVFEIAKSCGCKFYLGSDSHTPDYFGRMKAVFERAIDYLELKESDKFEFAKN